MSLSNIISTSLSGLFVNQTAIRATSNNVANVNTENYSRVRVVTEANVLQGTSVGVTVGDIQRVVDTFLETALREAGTSTSEYTVQREFHDRLQGLLGDPASDSSLSARIDDIFSAMADLALNPADVLRRQQVLSELDSFLDQINLFQEQIQNLRSDASQQLVESVISINEELQRINNLNPMLVRQHSVGGETGGLEGQLAQSLANLSEMIDIKVSRASTGAVTITTGSGYPLLDTSMTQLSYDAPGLVSADTGFPSIEIYRANDETLSAISSSTDLEPHIRSGKLTGLLDMRDNQLTDLALALGELAANAADQFNAIQNKYSAVPAPNSLTGKSTLVDAAHVTNFTGQVTFAVVGSDSTLDEKVVIDFDSRPSTYTFNDLITEVNGALSNGSLSLTNGVMSFTATSPNGVVITDDATNPTDRAGRGFSHYFGMNDLISADVPGIYETGIAGAEAHNMTHDESMTFDVLDSIGRVLTEVTVKIVTLEDDGFGNIIIPITDPAELSFQKVIDNLNDLSGLGAYFTFSLDSNGKLNWSETSSYSDLTLELVSDSTQIGTSGLSFTSAFGIGDAEHINASRNIGVKEGIVRDPNLLSLAVFDTTATAGEVALTDGDQRGALAFQELETSLVSFSGAGELKASSVTLSQYVARFLGNAGLQAQRAQSLEEDNLALQQEIAQRNSDVSGVNMDEELANLVVYQNAYNAAARVLSSVQELYDSLLAAV